MNFSEALKAFRRGTHVYGPSWRALVVCKTQEQRRHYADEALMTLEAGSTPIAKADRTKMEIITEKGSSIRFRLLQDADMQAGLYYSQIIYTCFLDHRERDLLKSLLCHPEVDENDLRFDEAI